MWTSPRAAGSALSRKTRSDDVFSLIRPLTEGDQCAIDMCRVLTPGSRALPDAMTPAEQHASWPARESWLSAAVSRGAPDYLELEDEEVER